MRSAKRTTQASFARAFSGNFPNGFYHVPVGWGDGGVQQLTLAIFSSGASRCAIGARLIRTGHIHLVRRDSSGA
jgi:hypothetical protein